MLNAAELLHLLIVEDDTLVRGLCRDLAQSLGFKIWDVDRIAAAEEVLASIPIDVVLIELSVPGEPLRLLESLEQTHPETVTIALTDASVTQSVVAAMRAGADDCLTKPFVREEARAALLRAAERRGLNEATRKFRESMREHGGFGGMVGTSPAMQRVFRMMAKVASASHPVLIHGESGTGKERAARVIHAAGPRPESPFVVIDCPLLVGAAVADEQRMELDLMQQIRDAAGGTVLLDEVARLPISLQGRLVRLLQEQSVSIPAAPCNARLLASTREDLAREVEQGGFRRDLYQRLNVVGLRMPTLRERREDIPRLVGHFLDRAAGEGRPRCKIRDRAVQLLTEYDWPGNVRELEGCLEHLLSESSDTDLHIHNLPTLLQQHHARRAELAAERRRERAANAPILPLADLEKRAIQHALEQLMGDKLMAARMLGIGKTTLYRKLKEYELVDAGTA